MAAPESERVWFAIRFGVGLLICTAAAAAYVTVLTWHSARIVRTTSHAAADALAACSQAGPDGYSPTDILQRCSTAADAAVAAAKAFQQASNTSRQFAASRIAFVQLLAGNPAARSSGLGERLAVLAADIQGTAQWWPTASTRLSTLAAYQPTVDLRERSATQNPRDFILRLYLAKEALGLISDSLNTPEARRYSIGINGIGDVPTLIDRLIIATQAGEIARSDELRGQFVIAMSRLRGEAARNVTRMEELLRANPWAGDAVELARQLR